MAGDLTMEQLQAILAAQSAAIRGLQAKVAAMEQTQVLLNRNQQAIQNFVNRLEATVSSLNARVVQSIATVQAVGSVHHPLRASDAVVEEPEAPAAHVDLSRFTRSASQTEDDAELITPT